MDSEVKPNQPAVTLYEEFFLLNEKRAVDDIVYACDVSVLHALRWCFVKIRN